ncbi:MAG: quinol dehydrogenase ferredoxin subunit NapH, partial [Rhodoblastus sp.]
MSARSPYREAYAAKGVFASRRFFLARRFAQFIFLAVFLTGPWFGLWIAKGDLASSRTFDVLPLTDPFILLQSLLARHWPETTALIGGAIVLAAYLVFGGRSYCAWVCPINPIADLASAIRLRFGIRQTARLRPETRRYLCIGVLVLAFASGSVAWELVNPITALHRALVFGSTFAATGALAIFVFDLFVAKQGWCGHICPVGAFYGALGKVSLLR